MRYDVVDDSVLVGLVRGHVVVALAALDHNAMEHPHIVVVATSNFVGALDDAFQSCADLAIEMPLPDVDAILAILQEVLTAFGAAYPKLTILAGNQARRISPRSWPAATDDESASS